MTIIGILGDTCPTHSIPMYLEIASPHQQSRFKEWHDPGGLVCIRLPALPRLKDW
jgi:hypothetical protein